jgi:hypothetical protein
VIQLRADPLDQLDLALDQLALRGCNSDDQAENGHFDRSRDK